MLSSINPIGIEIVLIQQQHSSIDAGGKSRNDFHGARRAHDTFGATNRSPSRLIRKLLRSTNESRKSARRYDSGRCEIDLRVWISHSSFEVSIGCTDCNFTFADKSASKSDARSASWRQRNRTGIDERLPVAARFCIRLHFGARCREIELDACCDASTFGAHDCRSIAKIFDARVDARKQICLLNRNMFCFHVWQ